MAVPMAEMIEKLNARGEEVVFLGDGVPVFGKMIQENLKGSIFFPCPCE